MTKHRMQIKKARQKSKAEQLKYSKYIKEVARIDKSLSMYGKERTFIYSKRDFETYKVARINEGLSLDKFATMLAGKGAHRASEKQANKMINYMLSVGIKREDIPSKDYLMFNGADVYKDVLIRLSNDSDYEDLDWQHILSVGNMYKDWSPKS